jgi:hypothetical protein
MKIAPESEEIDEGKYGMLSSFKTEIQCRESLWQKLSQKKGTEPEPGSFLT